MQFWLKLLNVGIVVVMIEGGERGSYSERNTFRTPADLLNRYTVSSMLALYTCMRLSGNGHPTLYTHTQMPLWFKKDAHQGLTAAGSICAAQICIGRAQRVTPPILGLVSVALSRFGRASPPRRRSFWLGL